MTRDQYAEVSWLEAVERHGDLLPLTSRGIMHEMSSVLAQHRVDMWSELRMRSAGD